MANSRVSNSFQCLFLWSEFILTLKFKLAAIHHIDSLCSCSRWSDMCGWHMNGAENIFDRLFLLSDAMIWSNFDTGIQDGHRPPFWISWIFTFSTYMHVIHKMGLIFMLQSHFLHYFGYDISLYVINLTLEFTMATIRHVEFYYLFFSSRLWCHCNGE